MLTRILIDDTLGGVYEIPHGKIKLKHAMNGRAGSMEFEYYAGDVFSSKLTIENGQIVKLEKDDQNVFYGYVFKVGKDKILCYDQVRYLKYKDAMVFVNKKASEILNVIVAENGLETGTVTDTKYVIPSQTCDNVEYLDMMLKAIQTTLLATGRLYFLQDSKGVLELLDVANTHLDIIIDGDGMLTDYDLSKEIDTDTYNRIKLVKDNEETGKRDAYINQDSSTMGKWGKLQYFEIVDKNMNDAQIGEKAAALLTLKNREKKTFKIKGAIGDIRCKAGYSVFISIPEEDINGRYLIKEDVHKFEENDHTMDLELVVY